MFWIGFQSTKLNLGDIITQKSVPPPTTVCLNHWIGIGFIGTRHKTAGFFDIRNGDGGKRI